MNQGDAQADVSAKETDGDEPGPEEDALDPKVGVGRAGMHATPGPSTRARLQAQAEAAASVTEAGLSAGRGWAGLPGHREGHGAERRASRGPGGCPGETGDPTRSPRSLGSAAREPGGTAGASPPRCPCRLRHRPVSKFRADPLPSWTDGTGQERGGAEAGPARRRRGSPGGGA